MTTIDRPLNDDERALIMKLACGVIAHRTGSGLDQAAQALDALIDDGNQIALSTTPENSILHVNGHPIVTVTREWLAFHATFPDVPINLEDYA